MTLGLHSPCSFYTFKPGLTLLLPCSWRRCRCLSHQVYAAVTALASRVIQDPEVQATLSTVLSASSREVCTVLEVCSVEWYTCCSGIARCSVRLPIRPPLSLSLSSPCLSISSSCLSIYINPHSSAYLVMALTRCCGTRWCSTTPRSSSLR